MTFFGLSPEYREVYQSEIIQLVYKSNGTYSYWDVYHMPIADRKWNIKWIIADIEKENDRHKKAKGEMDLKDMVKPQLPIPDYVSKKK